MGMKIIFWEHNQHKLYSFWSRIVGGSYLIAVTGGK